MAAVAASKPLLPPGKMKKPSLPAVQTGVNGTKPSYTSSPSSATKRLPGQLPTPVIANNAASANGIARPNRRPQRLTTRINTTDNANMDRRAVRKYPEPYVTSEEHILKKYKGRTPSLIVHLHTTHFRFDQQDGSFSYHSEMRLFIEHLQKRTIPHDMLEEFRKSGVDFYDGWLIVRVVDHKSVAKAVAAHNATSEDEKSGSIHNHTPYITPSPYAPYPSKEQGASKSPRMKQEPGAASSSQRTSSDGHLDDPAQASNKPGKPEPRIYHVALRPTNLSKHTDLVLDAMAPDPKSLHRRQSQAFSSARTPGSTTMPAPGTPMSAVPPTPSAEKGHPFKKQKMKIDARDLLEYEARVINATAPPLYLEPCNNFEEVQSLLEMLKDPLHDQEPPSPKSRKRTVAELAADDAHAKEQERFMQIMDSRIGAAASTANAGAIDGQAGGNLFQPRFEKWITLQTIRKELADKKAREERRKMEEDQERRLEAETRRQREAEVFARNQQLMERQKRQADLQKQQQQQQQQQAAAQQAAVQQQLQNQMQQRGAITQANGVPLNMQGQMMANNGQRSSPTVRQPTPQMNSSPLMSNAVQQSQGVPMAASASNSGISGSPPRTGSAIPHGHPGAPMTRGPSGQGSSRNGTPQIPSSTPGIKHATPILRQGTPSQLRMTQASPHAAMMAHTPQMGQAGMVAPGQMPNGTPINQMNPQQIALMNQRHQQMQNQAAMMQQGMPNGNPAFAQAQMAHLQAQRHAQIDQHNAMLRQQQAQQMQQTQMQQQQQQQQQQPNTPQQHASPSPNPQNQATYQQALMKQMQAQLQHVQHSQPSNHSSPVPSHQQPTPQQQAAHMANIQQQARQQQAMAHAAAQAQNTHQQPIPNGVMHPQQQQQQQRQQQNAAMLQNLAKQYQAKYMGQLMQKYGNNGAAIPQQERDAANQNAFRAAKEQMARTQMAQQQALAQQRMVQQQQHQQVNGGPQPQNVAHFMAMQQQQGGVQGGQQQLTAQQQQMMQRQMHANAILQQQHMQQQQGGGGGGGLGHDATQAYQQQLESMLQQQAMQHGGQGR